MAQDRVAVVRGTFLKPGISKNNRLYTTENIGKAVSRMQERLSSDESLPLTMFSSHGAANADNPLQTVGRVTKVHQEADGSATFEAHIANTSTGRDLAALVTPASPYLRGISIRGAWVGDLKTVEQDGRKVTTSDDLSIDGIDYTGRPGVEGAQITYAQLVESAGAGDLTVFEAAPDAQVFVEEVESDDTEESVEEDQQDRVMAIAESIAESLAEVLEGGNAPGNGKKPYGNVKYADPGYQKDKKKRYPIDTADHVRAAWSFINQQKNQSSYSSTQVARIKSRIKTAAKKFGINIAAESEQLIADLQDVLEGYASMCISNDGGSVSTSGYTNDNDQLKALAARIAFAAMAGLTALDPDNDGDVDLGPTSGAEAKSNGTVSKDDDMESSETENGDAGESDESTNDNTEAPVATENTSGTEAPATEAARNLTDADIAALAAVLQAGMPAKESKESKKKDKKSSTQEAATGAGDEVDEEAADDESDANESDFDKAVKKAAKKAAQEATAGMASELRQVFADAGMAFRKGMEGDTAPSTPTLESMTPKQIAEMDRETFDRMAGEVWLDHPVIQRLTLRQIESGAIKIAS